MGLCMLDWCKIYRNIISSKRKYHPHPYSGTLVAMHLHNQYVYIIHSYLSIYRMFIYAIGAVAYFHNRITYAKRFRPIFLALRFLPLLSSITLFVTEHCVYICICNFSRSDLSKTEYSIYATL